MTVNQVILGLGELLSLPIEEDVYIGQQESWLTFNFPLLSPGLCADDNIEIEQYTIQIHLFIPSKKNYREIVTSIKEYLNENDMLLNDITYLYESDTKLKHIVFECEYIEREE